MECASVTFKFESTPLKERKEEEEDDWRSSSSTTTSSSIGRNSDEVSGRSSDGGDCDENEVQSPFNGGLNMMDSLQQALLMRRGISSFYHGKSKSFTSLADASSATSIKEMAKPENAFARRRNLLAINHLWDKSRNNKRPIRPSISSSSSTLALAVAMSSSESISSTSDDSTSASSPLLPPLHPQTRTSFNNNNTPLSPSSSSSGRNPTNWRSFSLADVRAYCTVIGSTNPDSVSFRDEKQLSRKRLDNNLL